MWRSSINNGMVSHILKVTKKEIKQFRQHFECRLHFKIRCRVKLNQKKLWRNIICLFKIVFMDKSKGVSLVQKRLKFKVRNYKNISILFKESGEPYGS